MAAAHAHAAAGLAFQLASARPIPMRGKADTVRDEIQLSAMMAQRSERPLLAIDLAVPRDIEPACREIAGVTAAFAPARRAVRMDPLMALRHE